jgi:hypothetical protein
MGVDVLAFDASPHEAEIAGFLDANQTWLEAARQVLHQDCRVPLTYEAAFFEQHTEDLVAFRNLARGFALEIDAAERSRDLTRAVMVGVAIFELANAARRGGLIVDLLFACSIESVGIERLRPLRLQLNAADSLHLAEALLRHNAARESFDDVHARDVRWDEIVGGSDECADFSSWEWPSRDETELDAESDEALRQLLQSFAELPQSQRRSFERQGDDRTVALLRLLAIESALNAYRVTRGVYPSDLGALAPEFIGDVPLDPFSNKRFIYQRAGEGFRLYGLGPTARDSGGTFGSWLEVQAGRADLCLDLFDY